MIKPRPYLPGFFYNHGPGKTTLSRNKINSLTLKLFLQLSMPGNIFCIHRLHPPKSIENTSNFNNYSCFLIMFLVYIFLIHIWESLVKHSFFRMLAWFSICISICLIEQLERSCDLSIVSGTLSWPNLMAGFFYPYTASFPVENPFLYSYIWCPQIIGRLHNNSQPVFSVDSHIGQINRFSSIY